MFCIQSAAYFTVRKTKFHPNFEQNMLNMTILILATFHQKQVRKRVHHDKRREPHGRIIIRHATNEDVQLAQQDKQGVGRVEVVARTGGSARRRNQRGHLSVALNSVG